MIHLLIKFSGFILLIFFGGFLFVLWLCAWSLINSGTQIDRSYRNPPPVVLYRKYKTEHE